MADQVSHCLNAGGMGRQDWETETFLVADGSQGTFKRSEVAATVTTGTDKTRAMPLVTTTYGFENRARGDDGRGEIREPSFSEGVSPTVSVAKPPSIVGPGVRRLTPLECERLQGFPDNWTDVPYRGKKACDGTRYKAIGNSMAVNVMSWIGQRIQQSEKQCPSIT